MLRSSRFLLALAVLGLALAGSPGSGQQISPVGTGGSGGGPVTAGACLAGGGTPPTTLQGSAIVNEISGTTYTVLATDACKLLVFTSATNVAVTLPAIGTAGFTAGFGFDFATTGTGSVTITSASSFIGSTASTGTAASVTSTTGRSGTVTVDGTSSHYVASACTACIGGGVSGPVSSTDKAVATYNGTNGQTLQDNSLNTLTAGGQFLSPNGSVTNPTYGFSGSTNSGWYNCGSSTLCTSSAGVQFLAVTGGIAILGGQTSRTVNNNGTTPMFEITGNNATALKTGGAFLSYRSNISGQIPAALTLAKSNSSTVGTQSVIASTDQLGIVEFEGSDGTQFISAGQLRCDADGTISTAQVPGACQIRTAGATGVMTSAQKWDSKQHVLYSGATPSLATGATDCGTSPAFVGAANDNLGKITVGSSTNGGKCTVTFAAQWAQAPVCMVSDETTGVLVRPVATNSQVAITGVIVAGDTVNYRCADRF